MKADRRREVLTAEKEQPPAKAAGAEGAPLVPKKYLLIFLFVILLFAGLAFLGFRWMQSDALAVLLDLSGATDRDTAAELEKWSTAKKGAEFDHGDGARTAQDAQAQFGLANGARLMLKPSSLVRFQRKPGSKGLLGISVEVGEADVRTDQGVLHLDSEFGQIVIDAKSLVTLRRDGEHLKLEVELGSLQLTESGRTLSSGDEVSLEIGGIIVDEDASAESGESEARETTKLDELVLHVGDGTKSADLVAPAGSSFTIHDPRPPTAVGISVSSACDGPARLIIGSKSTEARGQANLSVAEGTHKYEVRCLSNPDIVAKQGTIVILRDTGSKSLPSFTPQASVATDGRRYTVLYQERLPQVTVTWPSAPEATQYTLTIGGRTITSSKPSYTFSSLPKGTHNLTFAASSTPPRKSRVTTVQVAYDHQAPKGRVSEPRGAFDGGREVRVSGQALPGWSVSVDGRSVEVDSQRRFSTQISPAGTLPIAFSHPTHGMHYYLRRPKGAAPEP